ncbi:transporter substrate-binding protein [Streptomyces sp. NBC_00322]|uniref:substrate-binding protein n=1 Tax=Streptomyces sp. NBC_00322 TaxID=2975712 RepID=UPI002E2CE854|nr:ABC transporter substrate-binding protein [Streptomyces sp. NBC_00322]
MTEDAMDSPPSAEVSKYRLNRRQMLKAGLGVGAVTVLGGALTACGNDDDPTGSGDIKIGFLSAFTGTATIFGETQFRCFELAVNQINAAGGIGGRKISVVKEDDATSPSTTIAKANKLALQDRVVACVGLITSLEREAALTVLPKRKVPLLYTTYYEGAAAGAKACDEYLVATGQVPNQQIEPLVPWLTKNVGKTYAVIGSDYIWPRGTTEVLEKLVAVQGGKVLSKDFYAFGTNDFGPFFKKLQTTKPDICWVTLAGGDFTTFVKQWEQFKPKGVRLVAIGFDDLYAQQNPGLGVGAITSQSYFMSIDRKQNQEFLAAYKKAYGGGPVNAIAEAAYSAVYLLKGAIDAAGGSTVPQKWLPMLAKAKFEAPSGSIALDPANQHTISSNYIAEVQAGGKIKIITSQERVTPLVPGCSLTA